MHLASEIRLRRERLGITQKELAQSLNTKQSTISRLETGGFNDCSLRTLRKVAVVLNFELEVTIHERTLQESQDAKVGKAEQEVEFNILGSERTANIVPPDVAGAGTSETKDCVAEAGRIGGVCC